MNGDEKIIEAYQLSKSFGPNQVVNNVNLKVNRGTCFGLLGPNGAGKSTLISMIYGVCKRSSGQLKVFGLDPQGADQAAEVRRFIGVVPQENALDEALDVEENLRTFARFVGLKAKASAGKIDQLLKFMLLDEKRRAGIRTLSGGMKRRLAFVRALLGDPQLLILDEPTTGLDPAVRILLWERIEQLKAQGKSVLLTTHYMDEAERLCDELVVMDEGVIVAHGAPKQLIAQYVPGHLAIFTQNDPGLKEMLSKKIAELGEGHLHSEGRGVELRLPRWETLTQWLNFIPYAPQVIRPTNLEDVFLHLTGRTIKGNA